MAVEESKTVNGNKDGAVGTGMAKPLPSELGDEMGVSQSFPVTTYENFAYGTDFQKMSKDGGAYLLGRSPNAVPLEKLIEMRRRDSQTRMLLRMFTLPILSCLAEGEWVMPNDVEGGEKETEFANQMFRLPPHAGGMSSSMSLILRQTLLSLVEGFSVFEEVRQIPKAGPLKGKIVLRKMAHRNSSTIRFLVDDHGGFNGVVQEAYKPTGEKISKTIPKEKILYYTHAPEENHLYGVSLFESAWYNYDIKSKLYYVAHIAAQMSAVPGRVGVMPQSATKGEKAAFQKALRDFAFNNSLTLPHGFDVKPFNSASSFDFLQYINHHNMQQAKSVLLQFSESEQRLAVIENGGNDASADFFIQSLESIMDDIAQVWTNYLMPKYIDWNFGSGKYPEWRFGAISDSAREAVQSTFNTIVTSSFLNCTPEFMREVEEKLAGSLGLDIDYQAIREREEAAAEAQAEMQLAEAEAAEAAAAAGQVPPGEEGGQAPEEGGQPPQGGPPQQGPPQQGPPQPPGPAQLSVQNSVDDLVSMAQAIAMGSNFLPTTGPDPEFDGE